MPRPTNLDLTAYKGAYHEKWNSDWVQKVIVTPLTLHVPTKPDDVSRQGLH